MQIKCVAIDNDPWALELIKKYVSKIPFLKLLQTLTDPAEAREFFQKNDVDLLFIDINIPAGIELLGSLIKMPITIFTSSYKKYAFKGFEFGAIYYLLKPVDFERFSKATGRAIEMYNYKQQSKYHEEELLTVRAAHKIVKIHMNDIEYIEGFVDYIRIHLTNDQPLLTLMTLKSVMDKLPPDKFKRIHRSYIVAVSKIKSLQNKKLVLFSFKVLPISRSYIDFNKELRNQK